MIIPIDDEVNQVVKFLSNSVGYTISMNGDLTITPVYKTLDRWEVFWKEQEGSITFDYQKVFFTLEEAAQFFVEKRRYLCLGVDFNSLYEEGEKYNEQEKKE